MKVNINRKKEYEISEKQINHYYSKYLELVNQYEKKGKYIEPVTKETLYCSIKGERKLLAKGGKYSSDIVKHIVDEQRNEGHLRRNEAIAYRKALKLDMKISDIQNADRQMFIEKHKDEMKKFYDSIKNNPKEIAKWNKVLGTNYSSAGEIMSNYFFGSK